MNITQNEVTKITEWHKPKLHSATLTVCIVDALINCHIILQSENKNET